MANEQVATSKPFDYIFNLDNQEANAWQPIAVKTESNSSNSDSDLCIDDHSIDDPIHNDSYRLQELSPPNNNQGSKPQTMQQASHSKTKEALLDKKPIYPQTGFPSHTTTPSTYAGKNTLPVFYFILVLQRFCVLKLVGIVILSTCSLLSKRANAIR